MPEQYCLLLSQGKKYPYSVVRSSRAKYIRIKLSNEGLLSLVIPTRAKLKDGQDFIQSKVAWIEKQLKTTKVRSDSLPDLLDLKLLQETWNIIYSDTSVGDNLNDFSDDFLDKNTQHLYLSEETENTLSIKGNIKDKVLVRKAINKWCQNKAKPIFSKMLSDLAIKHGFHYKKLTIRSQKTCWGSCSTHKNISLNSKLLFFDKEIVQYVMIHELCHTKEMNHSKHFWELVKDCDPNYQNNRKQLKTNGKMIQV